MNNGTAGCRALGVRVGWSVSVVGVVAALSACTGTGTGIHTESSAAGVARYGAALTHVVHPSARKGGILKYALVGEPDSFDPGNSYAPITFNLGRVWARSLTTYLPAAGSGSRLVPDLATSLGRSSDGGRTWTYTLRRGLRYSDGTPIVSADVKYAVERSNYAPAVLANGPSYFHANLVDNRPSYRGPYVDPTSDLHAIETPDALTIVFHLKRPFAEFDYLAALPQTAPVPRASDRGAEYVRHIVSSGSYAVTKYDINTGATLRPNPHWDKASDPLREQYAREIDIAFNREQRGIDLDLIAGKLNADLTGLGVTPSTQAQLLADPRLKARADDVPTGGLTFLAMAAKVRPLDNVACRRAVEFAVDKTSVQNSLGGPLHGDIASTVLAPTAAGHAHFDLYPSDGHAGDLGQAKAQLVRCGRPHGFTIGLAVVADRPDQVAAGVSIQNSLKRVGIRVTLRKYSTTTYYNNYAGAPVYVHTHGLGLILVAAWTADWPFSGYALLDQLFDGSAIRPSGNFNFAEVNDAAINGLLARSISNPDPAARARLSGQVDRTIMGRGLVVPLTYLKVLLYRPPATKNVVVSRAYAGYDLLDVGAR